MKKGLLTLILLFTTLSLNAQIWINELSYDMTGTDTDDYIEIVAPVGTDMSAYGVLLANGSVDESYGYVQLSGIISSTNSDNGFGFFILLSNQSGSVVVPAGITSQTVTTNGFGSGIQNGAPDGVLILNASTGATVHGIWYEETETPPTSIARTTTGNPPGSGPYSMTGVDITAIGEDGGSAIGGSISMSGSGYTGSWEITTSGTPGNINTNQSALPVELSSFSASVVGNTVKLNWRTETEVNNYGFEVERNTSPKSPPSEGGEYEVRGGWTKIGFVDGNGNSNSPKTYSFTDNDVISGKYYYRLKQIDNDGKYEYSKTIEVDLGSPSKFELAQNFPNPFNPETAIRFTLPNAGNVRLTIYNLLGQEVHSLVNEYKEAGTHIINFNASDFNSGVYIYKLEANGVTQTRKMTLIK